MSQTHELDFFSPFHAHFSCCVWQLQTFNLRIFHPIDMINFSLIVKQTCKFLLDSSIFHTFSNDNWNILIQRTRKYHFEYTNFLDRISVSFTKHIMFHFACPVQFWNVIHLFNRFSFCSVVFIFSGVVSSFQKHSFFLLLKVFPPGISFNKEINSFFLSFSETEHWSHYHLCFIFLTVAWKIIL